jgi:alkaline phosphatase D
MLDSRQYRSPLACTARARRGSRSVSCPELNDTARSKLGELQENWLAAQMLASRARWNLFPQGTIMAYVDEQPGPGEVFWNDSWNGYPAARLRFMEMLVQSRVANPVVLSGDIHAFLVSNLHHAPQDPGSTPVATEFVTTSISSQGIGQRGLDAMRANNPAVLFGNSERRGYVLLDIQPDRLQANLVAMNSVTDRAAGRFVQASFVVENGKAGAVQTGT